METRVCPKCKVEKLFSEFGKDRSTKTGLKSRCKPCRKEDFDDPVIAEKRVKYFKEYRKENLEKMRQYQKDYMERDILRFKEQQRRYVSSNLDKVTARSRLRQLSKVNATPAWADLSIIQDLYTLASIFSKYSGIKYEVDHIIPIVNDRVCGLHVIENLRVIPMRENRVKSNKFLEELL